ncbi:MAG: AAA family ATPase [Turicibacter sp.]|nr:AAA family ATPase [Turicibacter sp.]
MQIKKASDIKRHDLWRILIYSKPGIGKTTAIGRLVGKTLVLDMDGSSKVLAGKKNVDIIEFDRNNPVDFMTEFLKAAPEMVKGYDNLIVDNISAFQMDFFVFMGKSSHNGISNELQHYGQFTNYFIRVLTAIYSLPLNVMLTAWEDVRDVELPTGQKVSQYIPQIRLQVINPLLGLTDIVGRLLTNEQTGARGLILEGNDGVYAKNRLDNRKGCKVEELFKFGDVDAKAT